MTEDGEVRREAGVAGAGRCCCVLINSQMVAAAVPRMIICNGPTSGPDDPFCVDCEDRHVDHPSVMFGLSVATQRMRGRG